MAEDARKCSNELPADLRKITLAEEYPVVNEMEKAKIDSLKKEHSDQELKLCNYVLTFLKKMLRTINSKLQLFKAKKKASERNSKIEEKTSKKFFEKIIEQSIFNGISGLEYLKVRVGISGKQLIQIRKPKSQNSSLIAMIDNYNRIRELREGGFQDMGKAQAVMDLQDLNGVTLREPGQATMPTMLNLGEHKKSIHTIISQEELAVMLLHSPRTHIRSLIEKIKEWREEEPLFLKDHEDWKKRVQNNEFNTEIIKEIMDEYYRGWKLQKNKKKELENLENPNGEYSKKAVENAFPNKYYLHWDVHQHYVKKIETKSFNSVNTNLAQNKAILVKFNPMNSFTRLHTPFLKFFRIYTRLKKYKEIQLAGTPGKYQMDYANLCYPFQERFAVLHHHAEARSMVVGSLTDSKISFLTVGEELFEREGVIQGTPKDKVSNSGSSRGSSRASSSRSSRAPSRICSETSSVSNSRSSASGNGLVKSKGEADVRTYRDLCLKNVVFNKYNFAMVILSDLSAIEKKKNFLEYYHNYKGIQYFMLTNGFFIMLNFIPENKICSTRKLRGERNIVKVMCVRCIHEMHKYKPVASLAVMGEYKNAIVNDKLLTTIDNQKTKQKRSGKDHKVSEVKFCLVNQKSTKTIMNGYYPLGYDKGLRMNKRVLVFQSMIDRLDFIKFSEDNLTKVLEDIRPHKMTIDLGQLQKEEETKANPRFKLRNSPSLKNHKVSKIVDFQVMSKKFITQPLDVVGEGGKIEVRQQFKTMDFAVVLTDQQLLVSNLDDPENLDVFDFNVVLSGKFQNLESSIYQRETNERMNKSSFMPVPEHLFTRFVENSEVPCIEACIVFYHNENIKLGRKRGENKFHRKQKTRELKKELKEMGLWYNSISDFQDEIKLKTYYMLMVQLIVNDKNQVKLSKVQALTDQDEVNNTMSLQNTNRSINQAELGALEIDEQETLRSGEGTKNDSNSLIDGEFVAKSSQLFRLSVMSQEEEIFSPHLVFSDSEQIYRMAYLSRRKVGSSLKCSSALVYSYFPTLEDKDIFYKQSTMQKEFMSSANTFTSKLKEKRGEVDQKEDEGGKDQPPNSEQVKKKQAPTQVVASNNKAAPAKSTPARKFTKEVQENLDRERQEIERELDNEHVDTRDTEFKPEEYFPTESYLTTEPAKLLNYYKKKDPNRQFMSNKKPRPEIDAKTGTSTQLDDQVIKTECRYNLPIAEHDLKEKKMNEPAYYCPMYKKIVIRLESGKRSEEEIMGISLDGSKHVATSGGKFKDAYKVIAYNRKMYCFVFCFDSLDEGVVNYSYEVDKRHLSDCKRWV